MNTVFNVFIWLDMGIKPRPIDCEAKAHAAEISRKSVLLKVTSLLGRQRAKKW